MPQLPDFQGRLVRLTEERLAHSGPPGNGRITARHCPDLRHPETVIRSRTDPDR